MPQVLESLSVDEVSLVDDPANASVDEYGRKIPRARIALFKRDDSDDKVRKGKKMGFKQILKSATTRDQIVAAVEQKAQRIAKKAGISEDAARAKVWTKNPEAQLAYETAPKPVAKKAEPKMFQATKAEAELDRRARKRMKRSGQSYPQAVSSELNDDPTLYDRYQKEIAAGTTYLVPEPQYMDFPANGVDRILNKASLSDGYEAKSDDDDECDDCGEDIESGDRFCSNCGSDLEKKRKARQRSGSKKQGGPGGVSLPNF